MFFYNLFDFRQCRQFLAAKVMYSIIIYEVGNRFFEEMCLTFEPYSYCNYNHHYEQPYFTY